METKTETKPKKIAKYFNVSPFKALSKSGEVMKKVVV